MHPGTVIIDAAMNQVGCIETTKPTTHERPTNIINEMVHYCLFNMPYTSAIALTNITTLPYMAILTKKRWKKACESNNHLK